MSLMTMQNVVKNIEPRKVRAGTPDEKIVYDVIDPNNDKWTVWERDVAEAAWALKDQPSVWKVTVETKGKYTNRTLKEITVPMDTGMNGALLGAMATPVLPTPIVNIQPLSTLPEVPAEKTGADYKDKSIFRQVAAKVAATLATSEPTTTDEFWENVRLLTHYFETGQISSAQLKQAVDFSVTVPDGSAFPSYGGPEAPPPYTDDDLPF